jgi:hypothetical protein
MQIPNFVSGFNIAQSKVVGNEILRNLYVEIANGRPVMWGTPGILSRYAIGAGPIRQLYYGNGRCFAVSGNQLYELFDDYSSVVRGNIFNDGTPVCIASNRFQLCIVSGVLVYIYDLATDTLVIVPGLNLLQVRFADGYFVGLTPASQMIRISGQYDGLAWAALDFTSAEGDPDNIVGIMADHREIWTFGAESTEIFYNSGHPDMPFERIPGALIEQGCGARESLLKQDNAIFWLGSDSRGDRIFWRGQGYIPLRVSDHPIEYQLSQMSRIDDCIGYPYQDQGHSFCVWSFPTGNKTFVYDCATKAWHERAYWDKARSVWNRHRAQVHCFAFGKHLVGDHELGIVYEQNINFFDDNGSEKRWMRGLALPRSENRFMFPANLEIMLEVGAGINPALPGIDPGNPQVMLRYSKDGGYTFGPEKWRGAGKIGEYLYRCRWAGSLGQARKPYIEISGSDPARIALTEAYIDMETGDA